MTCATVVDRTDAHYLATRERLDDTARSLSQTVVTGARTESVHSCLRAVRRDATASANLHAILAIVTGTLVANLTLTLNTRRGRAFDNNRLKSSSVFVRTQRESEVPPVS